MKNVVAYLRVSTKEQAGEDKFGLDSQREQITAYCAENDMVVIEWLTDEVSGVKEDRPQFDKILYGEISNPPVEAVVVAKSDRIAREIKLYFFYQQVLARKGISLISIAEDFGEMGSFASVLQAFVIFAAEQERMNITKRTGAGRGVKARQGGYAGGRAPYGYKISNGGMVIDIYEAAVVRRIFELREDGGTLHSISLQLSSERIKTRSGNVFAISTIKSILSNKKTYEGMYKYGENAWVQGKHEAILK